MTRSILDFDGTFGVGLRDGDALTTSNENFGFNSSGSNPVVDSFCVFGKHSMKAALTGANFFNPAIANPGGTGNTCYLVGFVYFSALPGGNLPIWVPQSGATNRCQVTISTAGKFNIRSPATLVASGATGPWTGKWVRLEYDCVVGTQTLRIYGGSNMFGSTPDETLSGAITITTGFDRIRVGPINAGDTLNYFLSDLLADSVAQPGMAALAGEEYDGADLMCGLAA